MRKKTALQTPKDRKTSPKQTKGPLCQDSCRTECGGLGFFFSGGLLYPSPGGMGSGPVPSISSCGGR